MRTLRIIALAMLLSLTVLVGLVSPLTKPKVAHADSIPSDAVWSYVDDYVQAWARNVETDGSNGTHWNFVIQSSGGGNLLADYHMTYEGLETTETGAQQYVWGVSESVQGFCSAITESAGQPEDQAAMNAVAQLANIVYSVSEDVSGVVGSIAYEAGNALMNLFMDLFAYNTSSCYTAAVQFQDLRSQVVA